MPDSHPRAADDAPRYHPPSRVPRLGELTWRETADRIRRDPRLILPVGTCLQHGPHLPLDSDARVVTAVAEGIAARYGVLVAPTLPYGAGSERESDYAGTASLRGKTLHRFLNELLAAWERHGIREFVLMTAQGYGAHFGVLVTAMAERARVRAVDLNAVDVSGLRRGPHGPEHAGELDTSLLLYLAPELVRMEAAEDAPMDEDARDELLRGSEPMPPAGSPGVVGLPTKASAETGRRVYEHLVEHVGRRLFGTGGKSEGEAGEADGVTAVVQDGEI